MDAVKVSSTDARYTQNIHIRQFELVADEPVDVDGNDAGPKPTELLLGSLGACKAITLKMYAGRKGWPLERVDVELTEGKAGDRLQIEAALHLEGELSDEQKQRLLVIADKCPIHKMLSANVDIHTVLADA
ncbi:OsmC family protein [Vacuolonema iberomarrocanum]|uniref:OsmC family protein n=1 Tax=Vacuolonema iberomarrocanum TaxID=3454632 RepID=UPI001A02FEBE|nr:OsmC family protein [filamentous cyanobacterium LEGE 07170]